MTTTLNDRIRDAMLDMLINQYGVDAEVVTDWEDRVSYEGYCDTCSYETTVVDINYDDSQGVAQCYTYEGSFSELMNRLS